ncbi:YtxH domain-containing protein [Carnobacterium gallinarum]|uniref:YtxH domain-containing protein n=1 Tax=Carnobacterium gallinarum TaxID=2749 RepID=UPI0006922C7E|nr:YtxH domain-containing protein [Carnobacterium gallinarum]
MANSFFKGLLFGSLVGGAITLLTTPRSGKENRDILLSYVDDTTVLVDDVSTSLTSLKGAIQNLTVEGTALATEFSEDISATIEEFTMQNEPRLRRIEEKTDKLVTDLGELIPADEEDELEPETIIIENIPES